MSKIKTTTVKEIIATGGWWVSQGIVDTDENGITRTLTWMVCSAEGRMIGEFTSKVVANHVVKTHNRACFDDSPRPVMPCGRRQRASAASRGLASCGVARCKICYPPKGGAA